MALRSESINHLLNLRIMDKNDLYYGLQSKQIAFGLLSALNAAYNGLSYRDGTGPCNPCLNGHKTSPLLADRLATTPTATAGQGY